jgi:hypothetical protein
MVMKVKKVRIVVAALSGSQHIKYSAYVSSSVDIYINKMGKGITW